ncbi:hypothetical protein NHX12_006738 [Muraenolepis orangiensis]|uniref:Uncharacterized protein n=1 Tax=Muraenolepis orangiensis TaxID=630683 RepID=A0A9Q0DQY9_9TELE|nr:hypothetical protein NHX12_006738 [Muraenolepis orangiensis]
MLREPAAAPRTGPCSPVFYLLDNDHVNGHCTSPTSQPCSAGKPRIPMGPEGPRLTRRGPGRPPFRKAQSAACMEISLPVSHTEAASLHGSDRPPEGEPPSHYPEPSLLLGLSAFIIPDKPRIA